MRRLWHATSTVRRYLAHQFWFRIQNFIRTLPYGPSLIVDSCSSNAPLAARRAHRYRWREALGDRISTVFFNTINLILKNACCAMVPSVPDDHFSYQLSPKCPLPFRSVSILQTVVSWEGQPHQVQLIANSMQFKMSPTRYIP